MNLSRRRSKALRLCRVASFSLAVLVFGARTTCADVFYGVSDNDNRLFTFDSISGKTTSSVTVTGAQGGMEDIVPDGSGNLLMAAWGSLGPGGADQLYRLNTTTGQASTIGLITNGTDRAYWVEGLAWVNGTLYGSASPIALTSPPTYLGYGADTSGVLVRIDPSTGHATEVGAFGSRFLNVEDIAYSPKYGLIGSDIGTLDPNPNAPNGKYSSYHTTPALIQIDPNTGQATKIADLPAGPLVSNPFNNFISPGGPYVAGLDFSPDGNTLYGSTIATHFGGTTSGLVTIDPTTGALTQFGTVDAPVLDGITFGGAVPEPSSAILTGIGLASLVVTTRRRTGLVA